MIPEVGMRVVRGPDWKWNQQDNGEGHVGTVVEVGRPGSSSSPDKTVVVQWDMGSRTNYRVGYQDSFDLRLFDNAPAGAAGVRHPNVICDGCKDHGVSGMLFKCQICFDYDLCMSCYSNDTHELSHVFRRFDSANSTGVELTPRLDSPKIVSKGIFAGARVCRGPDWDWGTQDGGEGKVGRVVDIRGWDSESGRSVANVIWSSGSTNVYRLGHKGKIDLKCVQASSAGSYYVNHLPILGMPSSTINRNSSSGSSKPVSSKNSLNFNVGDKVQVVQDISILKELQLNHGGYNPRMGEFMGKVGVVHRVTDKGDIRVQYDSGIRWTFNPVAVTKIITYSVGDLVQVIPDCNQVKEFQRGHGEWVDVMKDILGATGSVVKVYADNDLRINFTSSVWTMNPLCVKLVRAERSTEVVESNSMYANAHQREDTSLDPMSSMLPLLDDSSAEPSTVSIERFVRDAAQGRVDAIKKTIPKVKDRINHKSGGKTALQVAAHQGHVEIVVMLIAAGANLEIADSDGDSSLHYASFGNQPLVMDLLLKAGALVNAVNKGQCTPLHVAVNKQFLECVKTLLKYKCNVNIQDSYLDTPLHDAIGKDHRDIIHCFMNTPGTDFTLKNSRGFNVLHHAALKGNHYAVGKLLNKARQLVDVKKDDGFAALHLAALNGHYMVVETLIQEGQAELDIRNNRKQTALTLAVAQGHCGLVELLVSKGASLSPEDEDGDTPLLLLCKKHFDMQQGQPALPNSVIGSELRKHDNAPLVAEIFAKLVSCGWSSTEDETGAAALACYLVNAGADINKKNRRGVAPIDLMDNLRLKEMISYYSTQSRLVSLRLTDEMEQRLKEPSSSSSPSFIGPSYSGACAMPNSAAATGVVSLSQTPSSAAAISSFSDQNECRLCSEVTTELVLFEPCGCRVVCEPCCVRMKKCVNCQIPIHRKVTQHGPVTASSSNSNNSLNTSAERLRYLEGKFAEIEENFCCSICMERKKSVVFLCGHGCCDFCSRNLSLCHMCRAPIKSKIHLF